MERRKFEFRFNSMGIQPNHFSGKWAQFGVKIKLRYAFFTV